VFGAMWPWTLVALGPLLHIPTALAAIPAALAAVLSFYSPSLGWLHLRPTLAMLALQWAEERVERRRHLVRKAARGAQNRMREVAENLMPPSIVQELREQQFGSSPSPLSALSSRKCVAHRYELLTVLQTDLVGFTAFASSRDPKRWCAS